MFLPATTVAQPRLDVFGVVAQERATVQYTLDRDGTWDERHGRFSAGTTVVGLESVHRVQCSSLLWDPAQTNP